MDVYNPLFFRLLLSSLMLTGALYANQNHLKDFQVQALHAPDDGGDSEDAIGHAVAMDGEWAVVGAPKDDSADWADEGSAYIMRYQAGAWQIHQKLTLGEKTDAMRYYTSFPIAMGQAVAISGDWLAVGVPGYVFHNGSSIPRTGRVLLFRREGQTWVPAQVLDAPLSFGDLGFGGGLALKGDRLVVGAPGRTIGHSVSTKVCLYRLSTAPVATWVLTDTLTGPARVNTGFGNSVVVYRDGVVIGLPGMTLPGTASSGEVRWYRRFHPSAQVALAQTIINPTPTQIERFGSSLSVSGDRLLVGCRGSTAVNQVMGCLWKKSSSAELLELETKILAPAGFTLSNADCPVALNAGRGFLACVQSMPIVAKLALTTFPITDSMPAAVTATSLSVSGTKRQTDDQPLAIATTEDHTLLGSSYELSNTAGGVWPLAHPSPVDAPLASAFVSPPLTHLKANDGFGDVIVADGDTIIASATRWQSRGSVHVFTRERGIWKLSHSLDNPNASANAAEPYGARTAISGGWMAVNLDGAVLLYPFREGSWQQTPVVIPQQVGFPILQSIDISGDVLITVASDPVTSRWIANRYQLTSTGPVQRSTSFLQTGSVPLISRMNAKGQVAMLVNEVTGSSLLKIFDTNTASWKTQTVPLPSGRQATSIPHSRSLTWDGADLVFHDANQRSWPIILTKKANAWTVKDPFIWRGHEPNAFAMRGDRSLVVTSDRMDLYQRQKTGWLPARELTLPSGYSFFQDHRSGTFIHDSIIHSSGHFKRAVFVHLLYDMEVYDGTLTYPHLALTSYNTPKDIGIIALGQDTPLPLTLKNTGDTAWTFDGLETTPQIITLPASFRPKPVPPGGTLLLPATLRPTSAGSQTVIATFKIKESQLPLNALSFTLNANTELPSPPVSTSSSNEFVVLGERFTLSLSSVISRSYPCRWLKNGRPIAGETSTSLHRPIAAAADAGTYAVEITSPDGSKRIIQNYLLCVCEQRGKQLRPRTGSSLTLEARAWGPGVSISWDIGPDDARIRGSRTPRLQILDWQPELFFDQHIRAYASMAGSYAEISRWPVENPPFAELFSHGTLELIQGEELYNGLNPVGLGSHNLTEASYSAKGLPPGLTIDPVTGYLTGTPTASGIYMVSYRLTFVGGQADLREQIIVHPEGKSTTRSGTLMGVIWAGYPVENGQGTQEETLSPGMMTLEVTASGKVSAQWLLAGRKLSAVGQYQEVSLAPFGGRACQLDFPSIPGFPPLRCRIVEGFFSTQIDCIQEVLGTDERTLTITGRLEYPAPLTDFNLKHYAGQKTAFLSTTMDDLIAPAGTGFATVSVSKTLSTTAIGTLPDGTSFTFASRILDRGVGAIFCRSESPDAYFTGCLLSEAATNYAYWRRAPSPGSRFYPDGYRAACYELVAYKYHPPAPGMLLFPEMTPGNGRADLSLLSSALSDGLILSGTLTTTHSMKFDSSNLHQATLKFYAPLGFFTGSIVVDDLLPGSETQHQKRRINFRGMLSSEISHGAGFFLLPRLPDATSEPPTTAANSPILSGSVTFSPSFE